MPSITARNARDRVLSTEEEAAVFETIEKRMREEPTRDWRRFRALIRFLLDTAARPGEALGVEAGDIEERTIEREGVPRTVTFVLFRQYRTKNDKPRQLPLSEAVVAELPYLKLAAVNGKLFPLKPATA
jgi:integrase